MSENNWGQLLRKQDEYAHQQDFIKRQRNAHLKHLYKYKLKYDRMQLDKMINQHKSKRSNAKDEEKILLQMIKQSEQSQFNKQHEKSQHLRNLKEYFAQENVHSVLQKRKEDQQARERERMELQNRFRKAETQISEQKIRVVRFKQKHQHDLSLAYQEQIQLQRDRRRFEKQEDRKYSQQMNEVQMQQQRKRVADLNRIKFGYRQNPEAYQKAESVYSSKAQERRSFLSKMAEENQRFKRQQQLKRRQSQKKRMQIKQAAQFNRQCFQNKVFQKRHESVKQALQAHQKWQTIHQEIQHQNQQKMRRQAEKRNDYKQMLERQMFQYQEAKRKDRLMSNKQARINRSLMSGGHSTLPGLSQDYSIKKQQHIMQNFLGGSQKSFQL